MSDQPVKPEGGDSAPGDSPVPEPDLLDAENVHLPDPDVSDAVEPALGTSAEEVHLSEPSLGTAEISDDAAEAASLDEAAAEAESVAREAEDVGTLISGPRPVDDPAEAVAPSGTAPAGGAAGDQAEQTVEVEENPSGLASYEASGDAPPWIGQGQDQARWDALFENGQAGAATDPQVPDAPDAPWASAAPEVPWVPPASGPSGQAPEDSAPPVGGPYGLPPAGPDDAMPARIRARAARGASRGSNRKKLIILGIAALVILALLIFMITAIVNSLRSEDPAGASSSTTPGADGIIAENISPLDLASGACVLGFNPTDVSADVTTVSCTTPHNAQLLATTSLAEEAEFPGEAALNASGDDLCNSVPIDENAAAEYPNLTLTQVTPTTGTWAEGDRRIDCFVVSDEGNVITDSLLAE